MSTESPGSPDSGGAAEDPSDGWGAVAEDEEPEYAPTPAPQINELEFEDFGDDDYGDPTSERVPLTGGGGMLHTPLWRGTHAASFAVCPADSPSPPPQEQSPAAAARVG